MPTLMGGHRRPTRFTYTISSPYGTCQVNGDRTKVLVADEISMAIGALGATVIDRSPGAKVCDVGTGSGILLASLIMHSARPNRLNVHGGDISPDAISVAAQNVARAIRARDCKTRASFSIADLLRDDLAAGRQYDLILANLPYLEDKEHVRAEASDAPPNALYGGDPDGLGLIRELLPMLEQVLVPGGVALLRTPQEISRMTRVLAIADSVYDTLAQTVINELARLETLEVCSLLTRNEVTATMQIIRQTERTNLRTRPILVNRFMSAGAPRVGAGIGVWRPHPEHPNHPSFELLPVQQ